LDLLAKPVFGALLIWNHRNIDLARLGLHIRDYDDDDAVVVEKRRPGAPLDGPVDTVNNGHTDDRVTGSATGAGQPSHIPATTV
jgi:hypothetical protein